MAIRKRQWKNKSGEVTAKWLVDYRDQDGNRTAQQFSTKAEADAFNTRTKAALADQKHVSPTRSPFVKDVAKTWLARVEANGMNGTGPVEGTTYDQYKQHVELHINPRIGETRVGELSKKRIEAFRDDLLSGLSRAMARKVFTSFRSILKTGGCAHLAEDIRVGNQKRKVPLQIGVDIPTPEQVKRVIATVDPEVDVQRLALILIVGFAGLRSSELRGLKWRAIDFKTATLKVTQRANNKNEIGPCKSVTSIRSLPLDKYTVSVLQRWKLKSKFSGSDDLVFPNDETGDVRPQRAPLEMLTKAVVAAKLVKRVGEKLEPRYGLHCFRHFFASWCINAKETGGRELPAKRVQQLMGHANIQITLDIYGHLFPEKSDRAELDNSVKALLS